MDKKLAAALQADAAAALQAIAAKHGLTVRAHGGTPLGDLSTILTFYGYSDLAQRLREADHAA